jgi:hypothetical protein
MDFDNDIAESADWEEHFEPLTTIGWLYCHIGSAPGRLAELDFLGGSVVAGTESPYAEGGYENAVVTASAVDAVDAMREGWRALDRALKASDEEKLERRYTEYYGPTSGAQLIAATLNEVSHHGTQICVLRDLYLATGVRRCHRWLNRSVSDEHRPAATRARDGQRE